MQKSPTIDFEDLVNQYFDSDLSWEPDGLTLTPEAQENIDTLLEVVDMMVAMHGIIDYLLERNQEWLEIHKEDIEDKEATEEDRKYAQGEFDLSMEIREAILKLKTLITKDNEITENDKKAAREYWRLSHSYTDGSGVFVTIPGKPTAAEITTALQKAREM